MTQTFERADELADAVVALIGRRLVLGLPVGLGKAIHFANAIYERAARDPSIDLTIFTALTLEVPEAHSDLERRFLGPLATRLWSRWPSLRYAEALRRQQLPPNIRVREFYFRPAAYLDNGLAQRSYSSINYTHVAAELVRLGVNVIGQLVAPDGKGEDRYSLGSNPEVTLDLLPELDRRRREGTPVAVVGEVNERMPYMFGDAELAAERFDFLLTSSECNYPLFGMPKRAVSFRDYATALHVTSLIPDGGTLQLGIGSLSDAVAHCLLLRHRSPEVFREVLHRLPGGPSSGRRPPLPLETGVFREGLYAATELLSDAIYALFDAGIICRGADEGGETLLHAGFFIGSNALYEALRTLPETRRRRIAMSAISFVNSLYGDEQLKRHQRRNGRFVNETMMVTLLGAAVSDGLDDGRVVSGVGGQFDFVRMAHALSDAHSILMFASRRIHEGSAQSNVVWSYGHTTVPRHYRDIFVCEYGIAATRGETDSGVIAAILSIADAEFQPGLLAAARAAGKIDRAYELPAGCAANTPTTLDAVFRKPEFSGYFPPYPLGTEMTPVEQRLAAALGWLKHGMARPWPAIRTTISALAARPTASEKVALERLDLHHPRSLRERMTQRLVCHALKKTEQK